MSPVILIEGITPVICKESIGEDCAKVLGAMKAGSIENTTASKENELRRVMGKH